MTTGQALHGDLPDEGSTGPDDPSSSHHGAHGDRWAPDTAVITREFGFDMGHMLPDHLGGCYRPHGHRYRGELTVAGPVATEGAARGMVLDFAALKQAIETVTATYDHRFAVCTKDPRYPGLTAVFKSSDLVPVALPPTVENLAHWIGNQFVEWATLRNLSVTSLRLWETPTCSTTWWPS